MNTEARSTFYIPDGRDARPASEEDWRDWFDRSAEERLLARSHVGPSIVLTEFLGADLAGGAGPLPILHESRVTGGELDGFAHTSATRDEALIVHRVMVETLATEAHPGRVDVEERIGHALGWWDD